MKFDAHVTPRSDTGKRMVPEEADLNRFWKHVYRCRFTIPNKQGELVWTILCEVRDTSLPPCSNLELSV